MFFVHIVRNQAFTFCFTAYLFDKVEIQTLFSKVSRLVYHRVFGCSHLDERSLLGH